MTSPIELIRAYFNALDARHDDRLEGSQFTDANLEVYECKLRQLIATSSDKALCSKATELRACGNYLGECEALQKKCETTDAWLFIEGVCNRLYHEEEANCGMI